MDYGGPPRQLCSPLVKVARGVFQFGVVETTLEGGTVQHPTITLGCPRKFVNGLVNGSKPTYIGSITWVVVSNIFIFIPIWGNDQI